MRNNRGELLIMYCLVLMLAGAIFGFGAYIRNEIHPDCAVVAYEPPCVLTPDPNSSSQALGD